MRSSTRIHVLIVRYFTFFFCVYDMPRTRLATATILTLYILSSIQASSANDDLSAKNTRMQLLSLSSIAAIGGVLWFWGGGMASWPNIIPLLMLQIVGQGMFMLSRVVGVQYVAAFDNVITLMTTMVLIILASYVIIPREEGWLRHIGVATVVLVGLPVAFALPAVMTAPRLDPVVLQACRVSSMVYSRGKTGGYEEAEFIHDVVTGARCGIYVDDKSNTVFVAFAGSMTKVDWLKINADVRAVDMRDVCGEVVGKVHGGFLAAWRGVRAAVLAKLQDVILRRAGETRVVMCGHSLGGATAMIAAVDVSCRLEERQQKNLTVVTFGAPRVGSNAFVSAFDAKIPVSVRVVTVFDPIPQILVSDFSHVKGTSVVTTAFTDNPITAHSLPTYARAIENADHSAAAALALPVASLVVTLASSAFLASASQ
jgi:hypothetical protein